jgi:hypothetical protein
MSHLSRHCGEGGWRRHHQGSGTRIGGGLGQRHADASVVAGNTDHHRHPPCHFRQHQLRQGQALVLGEFRHLAGHAGEGHAVNAAAQEVAHKHLQPGAIRLLVSTKRRRQHRKDACKGSSVGHTHNQSR